MKVDPLPFEIVARDDFSDATFLLEVFHPQVGFAGVPLVHPRTGETLAINCGGVLSFLPAATLAGEVGPALVKEATLLRSALGG